MTSPFARNRARCVTDVKGIPDRYATLAVVGRVCRLGLATRGQSHLSADAVHEAVRRGINYLNWCGYRDGMSQAVREMGSRRRDVMVAAQLEARTAGAARREIESYLAELGTDYLDVATYYYVEAADEWATILGPGGAAEALERLRAQGVVRAIGLTTHQRALAADVAQSGRLDLLMIRYNAAHRGAERQVFPITQARGMPVVCFTALRWGALMRPTRDDPPTFRAPAAAEWYRFVLCHPAVTVALMAPDSDAELHENLSLLDDWHGLSAEAYASLRAHGERVRKHGGSFP